MFIQLQVYSYPMIVQAGLASFSDVIFFESRLESTDSVDVFPSSLCSVIEPYVVSRSPHCLSLDFSTVVSEVEVILRNPKKL